MRISHKKKPKKPLIPQYKKNSDITASEILVLDEDGNKLGQMKLDQALLLAQDKGLDLIEINPKSNPPACKIMDYSEFKYQKEKEARKQKAHSKTSEIKGVRLSVRIGAHDLEIKQKQAEKFLNRGDKVKIEVILRGRENARPDMARALIDKFINNIAETINIRVEQEIQKQGHKFTAIIAKK